MSWFDNKLVLIGPYVGSFEYEITAFRPFVYWLKNTFNFPNIIISTHYNRSFLYDNSVIPIFKQYTKDEKGQIKHKHDRINAKDYQYIINDIKDQIVKISNWNKKDIIVYNLGYSSTPNYNSIYKKKFVPIFQRNNINDSIFLIPDKSRSEKELKKIYNKFKFKVIGTSIDRLNDYNILLNEYYFDHIYISVLKNIINCKCVITPSSFWTFICNQHNIPVFSWGDNISLYKDMYNFNNKGFKGIPFKRGNNINIVIDSIKKFLEEKC